MPDAAGQLPDAELPWSHRLLQRNQWVQRAVHCNEKMLADELVELEVVHVSAGPDLRRMNHHKDVILVAVDAGVWLRSRHAAIAIG